MTLPVESGGSTNQGDSVQWKKGIIPKKQKTVDDHAQNAVQENLKQLSQDLSASPSTPFKANTTQDNPESVAIRTLNQTSPSSTTESSRLSARELNQKHEEVTQKSTQALKDLDEKEQQLKADLYAAHKKTEAAKGVFKESLSKYVAADREKSPNTEALYKTYVTAEVNYQKTKDNYLTIKNQLTQFHKDSKPLYDAVMSYTSGQTAQGLQNQKKVQDLEKNIQTLQTNFNVWKTSKKDDLNKLDMDTVAKYDELQQEIQTLKNQLKQIKIEYTEKAIDEINRFNESNK